MKKVFALFLVISVLLSVTACQCSQVRAVDADTEDAVTVLFAGLDEAAENTDVLFLLSIDPEEERIAIMQIPRDTYFEVDGAVHKINGIYAAERCRGRSAEDALSALSSHISVAFSVPLTASVAFTTAALRATVDAMGGILIPFPSDMVIDEKTYLRGEHLLSGAEAEAFVRYREGYSMGDLGRIDAQKLFLAALLRRAKSELRPATLIRMLFSMHRDLITDLSVSRALSLGLWAHARLSSYSAVFFTLPGEPLLYEGHWYFIANRKSSELLLSQYFPFGSAFDPSHRLFDAQDLSQMNIYYDKNFPYQVFTEEDLSSLKIQTKKE